MAALMRMIGIESTIKGYHVYRIRPHEDITMKLEEEPTNPYDRNAFKVMMPSLTEINPIFHNLVTENGQRVVNNAGKQVGRVPANLCRVFRRLVDEGLVQPSHIKCKYNGQINFPRTVPLNQRFLRGGRRDRPGGGPELNCTYKLTVSKRRFRDAMRVFEDILTHEELDNISC